MIYFFLICILEPEKSSLGSYNYECFLWNCRYNHAPLLLSDRITIPLLWPFFSLLYIISTKRIYKFTNMAIFDNLRFPDCTIILGYFLIKCLLSSGCSTVLLRGTMSWYMPMTHIILPWLISSLGCYFKIEGSFIKGKGFRF